MFCWPMKGCTGRMCGFAVMWKWEVSLASGRVLLSLSALNSLTPRWLLVDSSATAAATDLRSGSLSVFATATGSHVNLCESFCVQPLLISLMDLTGLNQVSCNLKLYCSLQGNPLFSLPSAVRGEEFVRQGQLQSSAIGLRGFKVLLGDTLERRSVARAHFQ